MSQSNKNNKNVTHKFTYSFLNKQQTSIENERLKTSTTTIINCYSHQMANSSLEHKILSIGGQMDSRWTNKNLLIHANRTKLV